MMRVVTLDALQANQRSLGRIPIAVDAAMRTVLPIPVDGAVTLGAQFLRLIPRDLLTEVVHEGLSIRWMVTIQASRIDAVPQPNPGVLGEIGAGGASHRLSAVALIALEGLRKSV